MERNVDFSVFDHPDLIERIDFRVRYSETDPMGFVHNSRYLEYMEMGRIEALRRRGVSYKELESAGFLIVVVKAELEFKAPARMDDEVTLEVALIRATRVRLMHGYRMWRDDGATLCMSAQTVLACVDRQGRVQGMPETVLATIDTRVPGVRG